MTVAKGREFLSIPGPTNVPDAVLAAMQRPAIDIYSGEMVGITDRCLEDLQSLFRTKGNAYIYAANGHGGWEAALTNVLSRGDTVLALESGRFARGWGEMATMLGVEVEVLKGDWRRAVDPAAVEERLRHDKGHKIKALLAVQIDTASGVVNDIAAIRSAMDAARASGTADGRLRRLARLHAVRHGRLGRRRRYVGLAEGPDDSAGSRLRRRQRAGPRDPQEGRPAHALLGLDLPRGRDPLPEILRHAAGAPAVRPRKALDMLNEEGLDNAIRRHALLARRHAGRGRQVGRRAGAGLQYHQSGGAGPLHHLHPMQGRDPQPLLDYCRDKCGVVLGIGLGEIGDTTFRIAHMGHTNAPMVLGTLGAAEMGLKRPRHPARVRRRAGGGGVPGA